LNQIIANFDKNYEGKLKYSEFLALALDAKELTEEENL
jgi:hypothetical protein